jgi:fluoride exporter
VSDDEHFGDDLPIDPDLATDAPSPPTIEVRVVAVVFLGGCVGGLTRYAVGRHWPADSAQFPWATFWVNVTGAFALAVLVALVADARRPRWFLRPALGTGFLGAYTTFSALVTSVDLLAAHGHVGVGVAYAISSIVTGSASVLLGFLLARWIAAPHQPRETRRAR